MSCINIIFDRKYIYLNNFSNNSRFCEVIHDIHDTSEDLLNALKNNHPEISPSTIYAMAAVMEGVSLI